MILIKIFTILANIIYMPIKLVKTKNKITLISRQSNEITLDFKLLKEELEKDFEVKILTKKLEKGFINKIKYIFHMFHQMYEIASSKVVILDSYCIVVSILKHKKNLKIIQMWHALGSLKKFGYSILDKEESAGSLKNSRKLATVMKMHKNYNYIFASSEISKKYFEEAFNSKNVIVMPLPRVDILKNTKYQKNIKTNIYNDYQKLKDKKNILYVPTFRKNENDKFIKELIDKVDYNNYNLIVKLHPLSKIKITNEKVVIDKKYSSLDMMFVSDYIITDYSAITYEAAILKKPLYFYIYDINTYMKKRDCYIDYYKEMPGIISKSVDEILEGIKENKYDLKKIEEFSLKYVKQNKNNTKNIVNFIKK